MSGFEFCYLLAGHAERDAMNRHSSGFRDWCVAILAGETGRRRDTAARVADKALTFFLLALLDEINCIGH
jgi:hypothetical protein